MSQIAPLSFVTIKSQEKKLFGTGLAERLSVEPLVAVYPDAEFPNMYRLVMSLYIPDGQEPVINENFDDMRDEETEAGRLLVRQIIIDYQKSEAADHTWSLWKVIINYAVKGDQAQAIRVMYRIGDPETSRGTVTTVKRPA
ncbi:hypothetical protein HF324_07125 [Chitinophaga oryzae]|uniref:Uncharacterized protein n=1 Tax=Chitinophaga oryzae TaxID=2725414 RepID=A0AAE6ZDX1_9BACT|nr:hypothetical protein [Chitinophaga oryzae]QJB31147.1 hypothetical protein HF329_07465 [Chitinophaga oryzae]QJB37633.1 hypothetical protein HF324_07125 [Chitinophaga oryzae]